ncbi:MAG: helix-turn-helix domain-containing protein [Candidatus Bathyarchaeota archaeon]|nr:helix-turn-helix domain-containing protein [Candidatus Bathyarchaeota archaeon]
MKEDPPVLLRILVLLDAGNYPAKIARILGFSKQKVYYWIKKALARGFIERKSRDVIALYRLTPKGEEWSKKFLDGVEGRSFRVVRLHNVVLKYPILKQPDIRIDWRKVELQNWSQLIGRARSARASAL